MSTLIFVNEAKTFIWRAYNFAKIAKLCQACSDFCDMEGYSTVTLKSVFKITFENQALEHLYAQQNKDRLSLSCKNQMSD